MQLLMKREKNEEGDRCAQKRKSGRYYKTVDSVRGLVLEATRQVAIMTELHSNYASKSSSELNPH
jgi:hypothetical protein